MSWFSKKLACLDGLCEYYKELGMNASILPDDSPEAVEKGLFKQDQGYMKVADRNFELVTIRIKGRGSSNESSFGVGGFNVPVSSTQKVPFEYHHIVRTNIADEGALKAKLKKRKKGFLSKEIIGVSWEGGRLAETLNSNVELNESIMKFITFEDDIKVEPEKKKKIIRIIFSKPSEMKSGLLHGGFKFDRHLLPKDAIDVVNRIAGLTR
ncbi:hypothetical protein E2P63_01915 [Candidatus Bathyarchaeota archaeon]|nr:hypothetical protein E2P63_01915 [Candidatus Bathyarchaeota archaeon]